MNTPFTRAGLWIMAIGSFLFSVFVYNIGTSVETYQIGSMLIGFGLGLIVVATS